MEISLGKWKPDVLPFAMQSGDLTRCENLLPYVGKYMPALGLVHYSSSAVASAALAGDEFKSPVNGSYYGFIGTATKLYRLNPNKTLTDVTRTSGGDYNASSWSLDRYGDWYIAVNLADDAQILKGATASNFTALGGSPPKAKYCLFFKGHLIFANLDEGGIIAPQKIRWSRLESIEDWTETGYDGPDSQDMADAIGDITGIAPAGDNFAVFHESCIEVMSFAGYAPYAFVITNRIWDLGCISNGSIVSVGSVCYFIGRDDIYSFDGNTVTSLGDGVRNTVLEDINPNFHNRITASVDPKLGIIFWSYPSTSSVDGTPDKLLCYNYRSSNFTICSLSLNCLINIHSGGIALDQVDSVYPSIEDMPYALDSAFYLGNLPLLGAVGTDNYIDTMNGEPLDGLVETGEFSQEGQVMYIKRLRPKISMALYPGTPIVRIGYRMNETDGVAYTSDSYVASDGYAYTRAAGRYLRAEFRVFQHEGFTGFETDAIPIARR